MKILFAVSNEEVSESIVKKYQKEYKEIISYKNVYYFNAILKEIQKDKSYDRIVISEDLEAFTNTQYDQIDRFIFEKLDSISDEASTFKGDDIPIILICSDRRTKSEQMLVKLFGIGIYNALLGTDRSIDELCKLIYKPRSKKEAKSYYKIDTDDAVYRPESENDVSEVEIQNILAHYKKLGKDENKYIESFNNIAAQYNDIQLKIICKFLPLNVRAVLEEKSPKYQQVMAFNAKVSDKLRVNKDSQSGTSEKLLKPKVKEEIMTKPVVVPSSVNLEKNKKLSKPKIKEQFEMEEQMQPVQKSQQLQQRQQQMQLKREQEIQKSLQQMQGGTKQVEKSEISKKIEELNEQEEVEKPKRRGRPRKNNAPAENKEDMPKKKRGRPKKVVEEIPQMKIEDLDEDITMPGFNETEDDEDSLNIPGFDKNNNQEQEDNFLPGFDNENEEDQEENFLPGFDEVNSSTNTDNSSINTYNSSVNTENSYDDEEDDFAMPGFENTENKMQEYGTKIPQRNFNSSTIQDRSAVVQEMPKVDISRLLTPDKKIACFVGTSKNGTSFIVNHVAEILATEGINVAILDTTKNKNAYYIYTKNEEDLRNIARDTFPNLLSGIARGIEVNRNLTVYTSLPNDEEETINAGKILETLLKKHTVILIDCDFNTDIGYFANTQEIYLVQSLDVLTIQPLTSFLRELKAKGVLEENKLRIILNKTEKLRRKKERIKKISDKTIIGGMATYNDPSMSYMVELFDKNIVRYMSIPFDEEVYVKYLEGLIDNDISIKGYPKDFMQILNELANMVYPQSNIKPTYRPPTVATNNGFTPSMNSTLDQMRKY